MEEYNITDTTKFWIYVTTTKLWGQFKDHLTNNNNKNIYIGTFKHSFVSKGDIIIIYLKEKTSPKNGFVCIAQTTSDQIDNTNPNLSTKVKIYVDQNLNKFCFKINHVKYFTSVKIADIIDHVSSVQTFKKNTFTGKYLKYDSIFNQLDYDLGYKIIEGIFEFCSNKDGDQESDKKNSDKDGDQESKRESDKDDSDKDADRESDREESDKDSDKDGDQNDTCQSTSNDKDNNTDDKTGNIPVMIVLCPKLLNILTNEDDNKSNIIYDHLANCCDCDVTDNGNIRIKLLNVWKKKDTIISYIEVVDVDISEHAEEFVTALTSYHNLKNYNPFGTIAEVNIKLIKITDSDTTYNNCILIVSCFPEEADIYNEISICTKPVRKKNNKKVLVRGKKKTTKESITQ